MARDRGFSHAPSDLAGACGPCASGDHGGCRADDAGPDVDDCTCYAADWEAHELLARELDPQPLTQTIRMPQDADDG